MIEKRNGEIAARDAQREKFAKALKKPDKQLKQKLQEAEGFKLDAARLDKGSIAYSTDKSVLDQPDDLSVQFKQVK